MVRKFIHLLLAFSPILFIFGSLAYLSLFFSRSQSSVAPYVPNTSTLTPLRLDHPARLIIPSIGVDALIQVVGLAGSGEMDVPENPTQVGWYELGRFLSDFGGAVVSGHLNTKEGDPGVFADLKRLKRGDRVYIEDRNGLQYLFITGDSRLYSPDSRNDVFTEKESVALHLVTCDGDWDPRTQTYSQRLVVSAFLP